MMAGLLQVALVAGLFLGGVTAGVLKTAATRTAATTTETVTTSNGSRVVDTLKYVVLISRHGNRGASVDYSNDPYPLSNTTYWPYGEEALTTHGRLQAYNLGVKMRSLYNGFLPAIHDADDVYPTSDSIERVIYSGECVMTGLYPPTGWQVFSDAVAWQPITHYTDSPDNSVGVNSCSKYSSAKQTTYAAFLESYQDDVTEAIDYIYSVTGKTYTMSGLSDLYDKIVTEDTEGYVLPDWIQKMYPEPFSTLYGEYYLAITAGSDAIVRIYAGALYDEIVTNMKNVIAGTSSRLLYYYSGHDSTILNMQVAYGVNRTSVKNPVKVGSGLIMELHKNSTSDQYFIEVLYIDGSSSDLEPVSLPLSACGDPCYYDDFISVTYSKYGDYTSSADCS